MDAPSGIYKQCYGQKKNKKIQSNLDYLVFLINPIYLTPYSVTTVAPWIFEAEYITYYLPAPSTWTYVQSTSPSKLFVWLAFIIVIGGCSHPNLQISSCQPLQ